METIYPLVSSAKLWTGWTGGVASKKIESDQPWDTSKTTVTNAQLLIHGHVDRTPTRVEVYVNGESPVFSVWYRNLFSQPMDFSETINIFDSFNNGLNVITVVTTTYLVGSVTTFSLDLSLTFEGVRPNPPKPKIPWWLIYTVGGVLIVGGVVLILMRKKKKNGKKNNEVDYQI